MPTAKGHFFANSQKKKLVHIELYSVSLCFPDMGKYFSETFACRLNVSVCAQQEINEKRPFLSFKECAALADKLVQVRQGTVGKQVTGKLGTHLRRLGNFL